MAEKRKAVEVVEVVKRKAVEVVKRMPDKVVKRMPDNFYTRKHPDGNKDIFWIDFRLACLQCLPTTDMANAGPWVYYNEKLGLFVNANPEDRYNKTDVKKAAHLGLNRTHFLLLPRLNEGALMFFCAIASKSSASIQWKIPETDNGCKYQLMFEVACLRAVMFQTLSTQGFTPRQIELTKEFDPARAPASAPARAPARAPASAPASKK